MVHRKKTHPEAWAWLKPKLEAWRKWEQQQQQAWRQQEKAAEEAARARKKESWYAIDIETNKNNARGERHAEILEMAIVQVYPLGISQADKIKLVEKRRYKPVGLITDEAT